MQDLARLSDLATAEIELLRADGIDPTPAEVVEINALAWGVETPETRIELARGVPVFVGDVALWPLTLYAADWYDRVGSKMGGLMSLYALAFAMAHAYDETGALDCGSKQARWRVFKWAMSIKGTLAQLAEATEQVLKQEERPAMPQNKDDTPMTAGDFSAFLSSVTGESPEFWERRCSVGYSHAVMTAVIMQNRASNKPCDQDPRIIAERALGMKVKAIRESRASNE